MKRTILFVIAAAGLVGSVMSAPFDREFRGTSPRGAAVRVRGWGDEYSVRYEAADGHAVIFDQALGAYVYARRTAAGALVSVGVAVGDETEGDRAALAAIPLHLSDVSAAARTARQERIAADEERTGRAARWQRLKEQNRAQRLAGKKGLLREPPRRPTVGAVKGLTLLVDFPLEDNPGKTTWSKVHPRVKVGDLEQLLNGDGELPYGNATSVRRYYHDMSNGRLDYQNVVIGPITVSQPRSYYDDETESNGICALMLLGEVLEALQNDEDYETRYLPMLKSLDIEAGAVRVLNVWFAGEEPEVWNKGLWAHKSALDAETSKKLTFTTDAGETVRFKTYQITPITASPSVYTFCHENGHMLCDFPDLYSYDEETHGIGVGHFSIMHSSPDDKNPIGIDAYLRTAAGWIEPKVLPHVGGRVKIRADGTDVWRYDHPNDPNQYYLIENRQRQGHDEFIPGGGVLIWRCDESGDNTALTDFTGFAPGVRRQSFELSLEQADGLYELEIGSDFGDDYDSWYKGNRFCTKGVFDDDSIPCARWRDASASGLKLSEFSAPGYTMTFKVASYGDRPLNDDFANASVVSRPSGGEVRSTVGATLEAGEPTHAAAAATMSLWWRLEVPHKAKVTLSTEGSAVDTCLAVYTGERVDRLASVAANDDAAADVDWSAVTFDAEGGDVYYVAVAVKGDAAGDVAFRWNEAAVPGLSDLRPADPTAAHPYALFVGPEETASSMSVVYGSPILVSYLIVNAGFAVLDGTTVSMRISIYDESGELLKSVRKQYKGRFDVDSPLYWSQLDLFKDLRPEPGKYRIVLVIDSEDAVRESNERNNEVSLDFMITADPFPPVVPQDGETESEAVARELTKTFAPDSAVVRMITGAERLAAFNDFVKSCGVMRAAALSDAEKAYAYESFVLSSILAKPALLTAEPRLELASEEKAAGWSVTVKLSAGDEALAMAADRLAAALRVGTSVTDVTHEPTVVARPGGDGGELTFVVEKPAASAGFCTVNLPHDAP